MSNPIDYDIVVYGASGFTGRLVVDFLAARKADLPALRWAVAGRNRDRLESIALTVDETLRPAVIEASSDDPASLAAMAGSTRVMASTVGPYAIFGEPLVAACVDAGTDYLDLCGEVHWMRAMIDRYQAAAERSGARLVMSCGFDSIPSDLGVARLQEHAANTFGQPFDAVDLLVRAMRGGASGGTFSSMLNLIEQARSDKAIARILTNPHALDPDPAIRGPGPRDQSGCRHQQNPDTWTAPFLMSSVNTRVVRRSNALLGYPYGRDFQYRESTATGPGIVGYLRALRMATMLRLFVIACALPWLRDNVVRRFLPAPGQGPDREERETGFFNMLLVGQFASGERAMLRVKGDRDPGYGSTSKMFGESAIALATGAVDRPGGFWTPAAAFGTTFCERLSEKAGVSFRLES